jgi:hypothetical protein
MGEERVISVSYGTINNLLHSFTTQSRLIISP